MNILVTGGAGYIGSIVADELLRAGHAVTVYDSLVYGHRSATGQATRAYSKCVLLRLDR